MELFIALWQYGKYEVFADRRRSNSNLIKISRGARTGIGWRIQKEIPPMSGLAHGNSGILIPVLALGKYTGRTMYEEIADKIWNYEIVV